MMSGGFVSCLKGEGSAHVRCCSEVKVRTEDAGPSCFVVCMMMYDEMGANEAFKLERFCDLEPGVCTEKALVLMPLLVEKGLKFGCGRWCSGLACRAWCLTHLYAG